MKKSKKISLDNVGRMCKSGGVITTNITAKRLTTPVGFLNDSTELDTTTNKFGQFDRIGPTSGWSLLELKHLKVKNCNLKKTKNRSKSIFREIDKKYFENFLKLPQFPLRIIGDFTKKLTKQLHNNIDNNKNWKDLNYYKQQINNEIVRIDKILHRSINIKASLITKKMATTTTTTSNSKNRKRQICNDGNIENNDDNNKENIPMKYPFIPSTNWVFQTPPNRKLNFNNFAKQHQQQDLLNDGLIQPAVLRTCNDKTIVYEMNKFINVDLTNYQNKQEIDIDRRYMTEVTNIQQQQQFRKQQEDDNGRNLKVFRFDANNGDNIDQLDNPASDPYELEHHFLSLTCRPKKSISTVSRIQNIKRKRDMFFSTTTTTTTASTTTTPTSSGLSPRKQTKFHENFKMINNNNDNNLEEFEASFSLINPPNQGCIEESFRFKFTTTPTGGKIGGGGGGGIGGNNNNNNIARLFDFDGIEKDSFTFQCDME